MSSQDTSPRINTANTSQAREQRIQLLEQRMKAELKHINQSSFSNSDISGNIESFIGSIEIPIGLAGPIKYINKDGEKEDIYAPIATSEGALVASISRGALAISLAGGFSSHIIRQRMSRCPMFNFHSMTGSIGFEKWINNNFQNIKDETKKYSNYADLKELSVQIYGKNLHLNFSYETGDASGQNMTTTCTWNACLWIKEKYDLFCKDSEKIVDFVIEANGSSDKKVSSNSRISTRGIRVISEVFIPEKIMSKILKTSSQAVMDLYTRASSIATNHGMIGYNVNVANAIAAFFASTGQDLACIHESSVGMLQMEKTENGLYIALTLPSLVIGTTGGGTGLIGAQESLRVLDCVGTGKVQRLAKIICGYAMGLELSTMSAITSGQFATSHERLGRNHEVKWLKKSEIDLNFFKKNIDPQIAKLGTSDTISFENGIVSNVASKVSKKPIGFFAFNIEINSKSYDTILKLKPLDQEVLMGFELIAGLISNPLRELFHTWKKDNAFVGCHQKESKVYSALSTTHEEFIPHFFGQVAVESREIFGLSIEHLKGDKVKLLNTEMTPNKWTLEDKISVLQAIGKIHGYYFLKPKPVAPRYSTVKSKIELTEFYLQVAIEASKALKWFKTKDLLFFQKIIDTIPTWYQQYSNLPKTLVHNDFSPRNICIKKGTPCFYDWELAEIAPPQRDLIEFIAFTESQSLTSEELFKLSHTHLEIFNSISKNSISIDEWDQGLLLSAYEFVIDRLSFYMMGNIVSQYDFLERVYLTTVHIIETLENKFE